MASTLSSSLEVILYPTRATRRTNQFSRATMGSRFSLVRRAQEKDPVFRLKVTWGTEEAFTISALATDTSIDGARAEQA